MKYIQYQELLDKTRFDDLVSHPISSWEGVVNPRLPFCSTIIKPDSCHEYDFQIFSMIEKKNLVVYDVGANVGQSVASVLSIRRDVTIFSYEPNPYSFKLLSNRFVNESSVHLYNHGLSIESGTLLLWVPVIAGLIVTPLGTLEKSNLYSPEMVGYLQTIASGLPVEYTSIEIVLKNSFTTLIQPDFLKIDVEGHEIEILSLVKSKCHTRPILMIEKSKPFEIFSFLRNELDYGVFAFHPGYGLKSLDITDQTPSSSLPLNIFGVPKSGVQDWQNNLICN